MKKLLLTFISAAVALIFAACEPTTNVKWTNESEITGDFINEIAWTSDHGAPADTTWSGLSLDAAGEATDSKTVSDLTGVGDCVLDAGGSAYIELNPDACEGVESANTDSAVLKEGADVNLVIATAKKK